MNTPERSGAPALGNALGYFAALYLMTKVAWIEGQDPSIVTAMMGTICIHILLEFRTAVRWIAHLFHDHDPEDLPE